jgi:aryl-alcohol dehydrogenase-like predicted oxidoreductase/CubicO group peptidase (beta-lactamase class C family)
MPLILTKEIREIVIDLIRLKYRQRGKLTDDNLRNRAMKSLSHTLILNLRKKTYTQESYDGILSISLAYQRDFENIAIAVGNLDPLESDQLVRPDTPYNIASISKFVLMVMCCRLYQARKVSLDVPISNYISETGLPHLDKITLRHLLAHRSGFRDRAFVSFKEKESLSSLIKRKGDDFDLAGMPGERFYYANINFVLVAKIIIATIQKDLSACLEEFIVKPLNLKGLTVITENISIEDSFAKGYQADEEAKALQDCSGLFIFGATGLRATPSALTSLIIGFFRDDFIKKTLRKEILDSIQDETFEVVTPENIYRWPTKIGMGIEEVQVTLNNGEIIQVYGHGGWQNSHAIFMVIDPKDSSAYACCFSKTFKLEKIYQSHLREAWGKFQYHPTRQHEPKHVSLPLIGLGCVDLRPENSDIINLALKRGVTFFDTADCYGGGLSESALGEKLKSQSREQLFISSKCGVRFTSNGIQLSGNTEYIKAACEASLKRLQTPYLDLYYLHRIDPKVPIETSIIALAELVKAGKIINIGLSEITEVQLRRAHKIHPITAVQIEYAPWSRQDETNGLIAACQSLGIAIIAYSPLGRAFFTNIDENYFRSLPSGDFRKLLPRYNGDPLSDNILARQSLNQVAKEKGCSLSQLVLAWIMSKGLCVIPGTINAEHLNENLGALLVQISKIEHEKISDLIFSLKFSGERYPNSEVSGIFPEQNNLQQNRSLSQWPPSRNQTIIGVAFLAVGGLFAYSHLRRGPGNDALLTLTNLTKPSGP